MKRIPEDVRGELALEALRRTKALALASMLIHLNDPDDVKEVDKDSFQPTLALRTVQALKDEWLQQIRIRAADAGMIDAVGEAHDAQLGSKVGPLRRAFFRLHLASAVLQSPSQPCQFKEWSGDASTKGTSANLVGAYVATREGLSRHGKIRCSFAVCLTSPIMLKQTGPQVWTRICWARG